MSDRLERFAAETEPGAGAVDRLRVRLGLRAAPVLDRFGEATATAAATPWPIPLFPPRTPAHRAVLPTALLLAAVLLLGFLIGRRSTPPAPLDVALHAPVTTERALTPEIQLRYQGTGRAAGSTRVPRIHWDVGTLAVEVQPGRGIDLVVDTAEGEIAVVGTDFSVTRDARGTVVAVVHGRVGVRCGDGWSGPLETGGTHTCLPLRAAGWLARASYLLDSGAAPAEVLAAVDRGLATHPDALVFGELVVIQVEQLLVLGDTEAARAAARRYPADGPRAGEMGEVAR